MVATFESLVQPLILLVSVPFAATGALGLLLLTGAPLGLPSLIGMLMLVGIVVSNAIVLIDLINQYRQPRNGEPGSWTTPITDGSRQRLRPIVMTAPGDDLRADPDGDRPDRRRRLHLAAARARGDRRPHLLDAP